MDGTPVPPVPVMDSGQITRVRNVLAGGHLALEADRRLTAGILRRWPWTKDLVEDAELFHQRAALLAVTGGTPDFPWPPAAGVIFAAAGYPLLPGGFHAEAQAAQPDALFAYAEVDPTAILYNRALLAAPDPEHVSAYAASARKPAGLLGAGQAREILRRGPVMVQLQLCAHWWPSGFCAWAVDRYARMLPPGSTLALSTGVSGGAPGAAELAADISRAGGTIYAHTLDEVAGWFKAAGMKLPAGVTDVRGREQEWAAAEFSRQRPVARVIEAVALVPLRAWRQAAQVAPWAVPALKLAAELDRLADGQL